MKSMNPLLRTGAAAFLGLSLMAPLSVYADHLNDRPVGSTTTSWNAMSKVNKASSLIGMDVRNAQNEKLGDIKDLAVDLPSGKIEYAVLSVGGFLGIGDKYVAVPVNAFTFNPDKNELMLNADKAKVQNAPTFAKDNWPDIHSPTWRTDAAYWLSGTTAQGGAGVSRYGTATESTVPSTSSRLESDTHHSGVNSSTVHRDDTLAERNTFRGRVTAVDPEHRTLTVQGPAGTREFKVTEHASIATKENRSPRLSDLKPGYPVVIGYHEENGIYVANSIIRSDAPEVK
jgi:sporulation protein YlmC with PRC-barrel domain